MEELIGRWFYNLEKYLVKICNYLEFYIGYKWEYRGLEFGVIDKELKVVKWV